MPAPPDLRKMIEGGERIGIEHKDVGNLPWLDELVIIETEGGIGVRLGTLQYRIDRHPSRMHQRNLLAQQVTSSAYNCQP